MAWSKRLIIDVNDRMIEITDEDGDIHRGYFFGDHKSHEKILIGVAKYLDYRPSEVLGFFDNLINKNDYIAMKLWTREDVESMLHTMGYPVTEENVNAVIKSGELDALNDCTDNDWEIISQAIERHAKK